eukprot:3505402-Pyramimonas_sp.AAC.1
MLVGPLRSHSCSCQLARHACRAAPEPLPLALGGAPARESGEIPQNRPKPAILRHAVVRACSMR